MSTLGIDADAHRIAYAFVEGRRVKATGTLKRADARGSVAESYDRDLAALMQRAAAEGAGVVLEGIWLPEHGNPGRNVQGFRKLAETQGEIKQACRVASVPCMVVTPSVWHSAVLGFTRGRVELKAAAAIEAGKVTAAPLSEHEADAVCIGLWGESVAAAV